MSNVEQQRGGVGPALNAAVLDAFVAYERFGTDCLFEGVPMIHASVLEELAEVARLNPPGECVAVPRELLEDLRDLAADDAETYRQGMGAVRPLQQANRDKTVADCDALLAQQGKAVGDE